MPRDGSLGAIDNEKRDEERYGGEEKNITRKDGINVREKLLEDVEEIHR